MKLYFSKRACPRCGHNYDPIRGQCPSCGEANSDRGAKAFAHQLPISYGKQIAFFLLGYLGLQVLAVVISTIVGVGFVARNPGLGEDALKSALEAYLRSGPGLFSIYGLAYPLLFLLVALLVWDGWKDVLRSFKNWRGVLMGGAIFIVIIAFSLLWNLAANAIFARAGIPSVSNDNQLRLDAMIAYQPALCFIIFGLLGPFVEEAAYRVGLFGLASRLNKAAAYVIGILFFALIHFNFGQLGSRNGLIIELTNLPPYLFSGAVFCFAYDRFGFACSFTAHALNNMLSVIFVLAER